MTCEKCRTQHRFTTPSWLCLARNPHHFIRTKLASKPYHCWWVRELIPQPKATHTRVHTHTTLLFCTYSEMFCTFFSESWKIKGYFFTHQFFIIKKCYLKNLSWFLDVWPQYLHVTYRAPNVSFLQFKKVNEFMKRQKLDRFPGKAEYYPSQKWLCPLNIAK